MERGLKIAEYSEARLNYKKSMTYNLLKVAELENSSVFFSIIVLK